MASPVVPPSSDNSQSKPDYTSLYPRQYERNYHNCPNCDGDDRSKSVWRGITELVRYKYHSYFSEFWGNISIRCSIFHNNSWRRFSTRDSRQSSRRNNWFSFIGNNRYRPFNYNKCHYYFLIGLLAVGCTPAYADEDTYNTAAPESTATGNVTNQAVQFQNNGAPSRQQYSRGVSCNGSTMTFSPFWLASENKPYDPESYSRGWNYGAQLNFMVPLDGETVEQCKSIARRV